MSEYGYCPICGAAGNARERRPDGNDTCENNHEYKSRDALPIPPEKASKAPSTILVPMTREQYEMHRNGLNKLADASNDESYSNDVCDEVHRLDAIAREKWGER